MNSADQTVTSPMAIERARLGAGRAVTSCAVAGGRSKRAKTSNAPVIWLASAAVAPSTSRNAASRRRTGTPCAAATSGSIDANSSGRPIAAIVASTAAPTIANVTTCAGEMPRNVPNSSDVVPPRKPL